ncbi:MAG: type III-B CRISPR module RAMP protein Cmr6 [Candidatus Goldbacteria bacterium]|nr:type III-B CRISPR module RAMP protein Cmr6 [Candidatus Goldiibacteriota bacterium]
MEYLFKSMDIIKSESDVKHPLILLKYFFPQKTKEKYDLFKKICNLDINFQLKEINQKIKNTIDNFLKIGYGVINFTLKTRTRLIVGFGSASTLETSVLLDRVLGIPYIPGSSLKGCFRDYVKNYINDGDEIKNNFRLIFGSEDEITEEDNYENYDNIKGNIFFYNAYPSENQNKVFEIDVMNVHYQDYYSGKDKIPNECKNPVPINFLCVRPEIKFNFYLLLNKKIIGLKTKIENYFINMLEEHGVGAKTNIDYGYFKKI